MIVTGKLGSLRAAWSQTTDGRRSKVGSGHAGLVKLNVQSFKGLVLSVMSEVAEDKVL